MFAHLTWNGKSVVLDALPAMEAMLLHAVYMGHGTMCVILLGQCATVCQQHRGALSSRCVATDPMLRIPMDTCPGRGACV